MHMLTKPQVFYDDAHKTALGYQNPLYLLKAQRKQPVLYSAKVLVEKHDSIYVCDFEEMLIIAEEHRLKMKDKQEENDDKLIDYAKLNKLYEYFVPQKWREGGGDDDETTMVVAVRMTVAGDVGVFGVEVVTGRQSGGRSAVERWSAGMETVVRWRWCEGGDGASVMMKVMVAMGLWLRGWH
ncbi:hypothetical protein Tco_0542800 [Tanacetum coccineum]